MKVVILIIFSLLLSGCGKTPKDDPKVEKVPNINIVEEQNDFTIENSDIEVYSDTTLNNLIKINNESIKIENLDEVIDTDELGSKDIDVIYEKDNKKYSYTFTVNVKDTEPPRLLSGVNRIVNVGNKGDICDVIIYGDNYTGDVKCEVSGNYDFNTVGSYKLKYKLSDSSNNTKEVNVTLNVVKPSSGGGGTSEPAKKTEFADILAKHKNDKTEVGIDVSKWQGDIDFNKVKNAGATFVMMRIGVQSSIGGSISIDQYFKQNIKKAKEAGLKVGVYLYTYASSVEDALNQVKWVVDTLDGEALDLPIAFDWENWSKWNSFKVSFHEINKIANTFMSEARNKGYEGMLYSSKNYLETIWTNKLDYPVWLAHYTSKTNYAGKYIIWQLCNNGRIDGINGDVDIDIMYN